MSAIDEAKPWLAKNGIISDSVKFNAYDGPGLTRNLGATVIVGLGVNENRERVGFALEIAPGKGVVESEILVPYGIATHGDSASFHANGYGHPMLDVLVNMAENHRARTSTKH